MMKIKTMIYLKPWNYHGNSGSLGFIGIAVLEDFEKLPLDIAGGNHF